MIIGFGYQKGVGKNIACEALAEMGYQTVGFADALKAEVTTRLRATCLEIARLHYREDVFDNVDDNIKILMLIKDKPSVIRRLLQEYGTEVRRADDPNYWVKQLSTKIMLTPYYERKFAICDVRFPNEAKMVHDFDGRCIRITRPAYLREDSHASELEGEKIDWDCVIANEETIPDLQRKVREQITHWQYLARSR